MCLGTIRDVVVMLYPLIDGSVLFAINLPIFFLLFKSVLLILRQNVGIII